MGANHGGSGRAGPHEEEEQQAGVAAELMVLRSVDPAFNLRPGRELHKPPLIGAGVAQNTYYMSLLRKIPHIGVIRCR